MKRCPHVIAPPGQPWFFWECAECKDSGVRMRALSLTDPYPYLILDLPDEHRKDIENRKRPVMNTLGPLLIHVTKTCNDAQYEASLKVARAAGVPEELLPDRDSRPRMGTVGAVIIDQVLPRVGILDSYYRWKFPAHVAYVIGKRVKLPFRSMPGAQSVFQVDLTTEEVAILKGAGII